MSRPFSRITEEPGPETQGTEARAGNATGTRVRSWWGGSRGEGRRESISSNENVPKSPSQGNEMVSVSSNFAGSSPIITPDFYNMPTSVLPVSPRARTNTMLFVPQPQLPLQNSMHPLERPQPAAIRNETIGTGDPAMAEAAYARSQTQEPVDFEAQRTVQSRSGKWWWQRGSLKGLQSRLLICLVSGTFLAVILAVYLGLVLNNEINLRHEWNAILILMILMATMFFCHSLVRLCVIAANPGRFQRASRNFSRIPSVSGPDGYANPREPIRIQTHFEHDVDGVEPDLTKIPPPVYGLWRCSVRVNPDQFYWVRRMSAQQPTIPEGREPAIPTSGRSNGTPRPPSYASDDGVSYALVADNSLPPIRPDPPLPPHPSEARRIPG